MHQKRQTYLIQDPHDEDAIQFIRTISLYFGLRPVCFYTDKKARFYGEQQFPLLRGNLIESSYDVSLDDLRPFCDEVGGRYHILGVVPYREDTVEVAAELCGMLGLDWNDAETLGRFRDKFELKRHVASRDPSVRVPECRLVRTVEDVWNGPALDRFVIKPNSGFGNMRIGIFDANERDKIDAHVQGGPATTWILEEFIGGTEFHVNGQVRRDGEVTILAVFEYTRTAVNNYPTVYSGERQCRTTHPQFEAITEYARRLLAATELRACPFHLEVKVDANGPCVVDLGARFASEGGPQTFSRLHPDRPDAYAVAAHDYLGDNTFAKEPVDYRHYNSELNVAVYGISHERETIENLEGVDEIEALPEFVRWAVKPRIGDHVHPTKDLRGAPYIVELRHFGDDAGANQLIERVRATIRWNQRTSAAGRLRAETEQMVRSGVPKLRWMAHSAARYVGR